MRTLSAGEFGVNLRLSCFSLSLWLGKLECPLYQNSVKPIDEGVVI